MRITKPRQQYSSLKKLEQFLQINFMESWKAWRHHTWRAFLLGNRPLFRSMKFQYTCAFA